MTWISVKDKLPKNFEPVLLIIGVRIYIGKRGDYDNIKDKRYTWLTRDGLSSDKDVTHWMPLPEPPKEDKND